MSTLQVSYMTWSWIAVGLACTIFGVTCTNVPRTKGRVLWCHFLFVLAIPCLLLLRIPNEIQNHIFSPLSIALIATIYPIHESIKAVCTLDSFVVDNTWLQYWMTQVILFYSSILLWKAYDYNSSHENRIDILYRISFFYTLWLVLPFTDGSTLLFDGITSFCFKPILNWIPKVFRNKLVGIVTRSIINIIHLIAIVWMYFELNSQWIPLVVIGITTFYPLLASFVSLATTDKSDTYFWLIYWSMYGFGILLWITIGSYTLINMQYYYSVFLLLMMYLMLPLFRGAEQVFRSILVPLAGLDEILLIYDSHQIKVTAMQRLPPKRKKQVLRMISTSFFEAQEVCEEDEWLRSGDAYDEALAFKQGYHSIPQRFSEI